MGKQIVPSYPKVSPMVFFTLMTPYDYHMGHHGHSFVTTTGLENHRKTCFWQFSAPKPTNLPMALL
jgi:hypothetical protein